MCVVWSVGHYALKNAINFVDVRVSVEITHDSNGFQMQTEHLSFDPELRRQANLDL